MYFEVFFLTLSKQCSSNTLLLFSYFILFSGSFFSTARSYDDPGTDTVSQSLLVELACHLFVASSTSIKQHISDV